MRFHLLVRVESVAYVDIPKIGSALLHWRHHISLVMIKTGPMLPNGPTRLKHVTKVIGYCLFLLAISVQKYNALRNDSDCKNCYTCLVLLSACNKNILPGTSTTAKKNPQDQHGSRNTKIIFVAVLCLLILLVGSVCFCWVRQKRDLPQTEIRRFSSPGPKGPGRLRRRSLGGSPSV
jgi:hypothetical protein